jgi:hypothetical protein
VSTQRSASWSYWTIGSPSFVLDDRVAVVVRLAAPAEALPDDVSVLREAGLEVESGDLPRRVPHHVVDGVAEVDPLHVVVRAEVAGRVGRRDAVGRINADAD